MTLMIAPPDWDKKKRPAKRPKKIKYLHDCPTCRHQRSETCDFVVRRSGRDCSKKAVWITGGLNRARICGSHKGELDRLTKGRETFTRIRKPRPFA